MVAWLLGCSAKARPQGVVEVVADFSAAAPAWVVEAEFTGGNWLVTNGGRRSR